MRRKAILIVTSLSILLLNGCIKTIFDNEDVRCPFVERGGCQSMNDINKMVSQKRYTSDGSYVQQAYKPTRNTHSKARRLG